VCPTPHIEARRDKMESRGLDSDHHSDDRRSGMLSKIDEKPCDEYFLVSTGLITITDNPETVNAVESAITGNDLLQLFI
jgi:hypothetical protein